MTSKNVFRMIDYLVIILSIVMILTMDDFIKRLLWFNALVWQVRCVLTDLSLDLQKEINETQKKICDERGKQIDVLLTSLNRIELWQEPRKQ